MRIAVDVMGGDFAPQAPIEGSLMASKDWGLEVILVGKEELIRPYLKGSSSRISIQPASEVIGMDEPAASSMRRKRDSSIVVGIELLKKAEADAFVSAGNTGAVVCASTLNLGLLPEIERPGIALIMPNLKGTSLLIDAGANIDPKPVHLLQYAIMAEAYSRHILNKDNPKVGLLNIGEEKSKGTEFVKETHQLLSASQLNFIGNIEGKDIFSGDCDCIISDGFVGNVTLKVCESFAEAVGELLYRQLNTGFLGRLGFCILKKGLLQFKKSIDYSEYGGAILLGVNGICIIGHGRSSSNALKNAIRVAKEEVENRVNERIIEAIKSVGNQ